MHFTVVQKVISLLVMKNGSRRQSLDVPNVLTLKKQIVRKFCQIKNYEIQKFVKYKVALGWEWNGPKGLNPLDDDKDILGIRW
jgi:hypothetical protein